MGGASACGKLILRTFIMKSSPPKKKKIKKFFLVNFSNNFSTRRIKWQKIIMIIKKNQLPKDSLPASKGPFYNTIQLYTRTCFSPEAKIIIRNDTVTRRCCGGDVDSGMTVLMNTSSYHKHTKAFGNVIMTRERERERDNYYVVALK